MPVVSQAVGTLVHNQIEVERRDAIAAA